MIKNCDIDSFCEDIRRKNYKFSWDRMVDVIEELA